MMNSIIALGRQPLDSNPIFHDVIAYFSKNNRCEYHNIRKSFLTLILQLSKFSTVFINDPIVYLLVKLFIPKKTKIIFFSIEMFEYQLPDDSFRNRIRNYIFKKCHNLAITTSNLVVFSNELRQSYYQKLYNNKINSFILENRFSERRRPQTPPSLKIKNKLQTIKDNYSLIVGYVGGVRDVETLENIAGAAQETAQKNLCVVFAGSAPKEAMEKALKTVNVFHLGFLNRGDVHYLLENIDAGILCYPNQPLNNKFAAPVKLYEYLAYRLQIIGNDNFSLKNHGNDIKYYFNDKKSLTSIFDNLVKLPKNSSHIHYIEDDLDKLNLKIKNLSS